MPAPSPQVHFGVYAAVIREECLLAVRKRRGPYSNFLDLPGGSPLPAESLTDALARELEEEIGGRPTYQGPWWSFDLAVTQNSVGEPIDFRHAGRWQYAIVPSVVFDLPPFEDVDGIELINLHTWPSRSDLSDPLRHVLSNLRDYCLAVNLPYPHSQ